MTISSFSSAITKGEAPVERVRCMKASSGAVGTPAFGSFFLVAGNPVVATAPTTAVVPTNSTAGSVGQQNGGSLQLRLSGYRYYNSSSQNVGLLIDRLSHQGGLDATVTSAQTTNLPTAALTRYTNGVGVKMALHIYTLVGTVATTLSVSYTNSAGVAGRTSPSIVFGAALSNEAQRIIQIPLQSGDVGVKSVESVTVLASTTTAGNFGILLYKEIAPLIQVSVDYLSDVSPWLSLGGYSPEIFDNACLEFWGISNGSNVTGFAAELKFSEDDS